jgi:hypothetical protein
VGTTVLFGSTMPLVQKILVPPVEEEKHEYDKVEDVDGGENNVTVNEDDA